MSDREIMSAKRAGNNTPPSRISKLINKLTSPFSKQQHYPDARRHQIISFIKSGIRIIGYGFIPFSLITATILLVISEVVGIIEELV